MESWSGSAVDAFALLQAVARPFGALGVEEGEREAGARAHLLVEAGGAQLVAARVQEALDLGGAPSMARSMLGRASCARRGSRGSTNTSSGKKYASACVKADASDAPGRYAGE